MNREQLKSLLDRASARGKCLDKAFMDALQRQISTLSSMPELEESIRQDRKPKAIAMMEKLIHLTQEEREMLYVRRLTPSECEILQGFPPGWTEIDTEQ